jgi:hypothetical protein
VATPKFDAEQAVRVLLLAELSGDAEAAKTAGLTERTIRRWRQKLGSDPRLSQAVREKRDQTNAHLDGVYRDFMRGAVRKLGSLVESADVEKIHQVAGAVKIVGDLMNFRSAVGVERPEEEDEGDGRQPGGARTSGEDSPPARVLPIRPAGVRTSN